MSLSALTRVRNVPLESETLPCFDRAAQVVDDVLRPECGLLGGARLARVSGAYFALPAACGL